MNSVKSTKRNTSNDTTKASMVINLLCRPAGAPIAQLMKATGWQSHSVRGFLAGSLKKKGYTVSSKLDEKGERRYRAEAPVKA